MPAALGCTSMLKCEGSLVWFVGRISCGCCVCLEADCCVLANLLLRLQVGQIRTMGFGNFARSGGACAACPKKPAELAECLWLELCGPDLGRVLIAGLELPGYWA